MKVLADCFHKCLERSQNSPEFHRSANFTQKIRPLKLYILKQYQKKRLFDGFPVSKAKMFKGHYEAKIKISREIGERGV